ncbi:WXG100 family type VII secretion target [Kibdelosporangium aridum]|uniref:Proteins of 100 residues with WXG n=1 Tax=Kibdelosporangium aridum TaxID=2030 RepID=A0A1W2CWI1_KIBAR|nr:WXG100 family type VII secretion target [Kibdelosporangium aridum]SMC89603.1 Proteins of 100 residues with WXG [Kibdelosporangium aridum]
MNNLDYLSQLCRDLGVPDIVEEYFAPVVGRWSDMHEEADRWRAAATAADEVTASLNKPLGALDAAWEGKTADSFVDYMQTVGLAGNDMSDAMHAMAKVLDKTADGIREIVMEMGDVLSDTAEASAQSMAMPLGEERTRQHIETMRKPIRESFESVRQVLEAFVNLCDGVDGSKAFERVKMSHTYPTENWTVDIDVPAEPPAHQTAEPAAASVGGSGAAGVGGGGAAAVGGPPASLGGPPASPPAPSGPGVFAAIGEVNPAPPPQQAAAAAAARPAAAGGMGMGGGMMVPPMMFGGAPGGGSQEHTNKTRVVSDPNDLFGEPADASPSVIGDED